MRYLDNSRIQTKTDQIRTKVKNLNDHLYFHFCYDPIKFMKCGLDGDYGPSDIKSFCCENEIKDIF